MSGETDPLSGELAEIAEDFAALPVRERLQLLLQFSHDLPELPAKYAEHPELLEPVPECQSPIFVTSEVTAGIVDLYFSAPPEAPTTRGFAGILHAGLSGRPVDEVLSVPNDLSHRLSLADAVSPLRLNGMAGMLARIKRQVRGKAPAR
jgi:cysteine desulfuration protein SufE